MKKKFTKISSKLIKIEIFIYDENISNVHTTINKLHDTDGIFNITPFTDLTALLQELALRKLKNKKQFTLGIIDYTIKGDTYEMLSVLLKTEYPDIRIVVNSLSENNSLNSNSLFKVDYICNKIHDDLSYIVKSMIESF